MIEDQLAKKVMPDRSEATGLCSQASEFCPRKVTCYR